MQCITTNLNLIYFTWRKVYTHTLIDRLGGYPGASWVTEHCSVWVRSWVFRTQNWHRGWIGGKKPPDLSFASLKFGGVLQVNDKLTLEPIFRQFLLIIFVTFNDIFGKLIDGVWTKDRHYCKQNWPRGLTRLSRKNNFSPGNIGVGIQRERGGGAGGLMRPEEKNTWSCKHVQTSNTIIH